MKEACWHDEMTGHNVVWPKCDVGTGGSPCVQFSKLFVVPPKERDAVIHCVNSGSGESGKGYCDMIEVYGQERFTEFANENAPLLCLKHVSAPLHLFRLARCVFVCV